jgi:hypothetical protein
MAKLQVKVSNVDFDFSGSDVDENYMIDITEDYEGKILEVEFDDPEEEKYFEDYLIEALTDHISNVSGWCVNDYDYEIVTVR